MSDPYGSDPFRRSHRDRSEIGRDALDELAPLRPLGIWDVVGRTRAALGLRPLTAPALVFVPLGALAGPYGAGIVSHDALGSLYPVMSVALAALGIFVGAALRLGTADDRRLLAVGSLEALITIGVVAGVCLWLFRAWGLQLEGPWSIALVLGLCASATSAGVARPEDPLHHQTAMRIADLDDVLPIALGGIVLAMVTADTTPMVATLAALNVGVALLIAAAGWLLFGWTHDPDQRTVFVVGIVALLGGSAAYLGVSPLLAGMVAGIVWRHAPGGVDAIIGLDLRRLQHPLVVLLLIFAGASAQPNLLAVWIGSAYVLARLSGKMLGGWVISRATPTISPADLGSYLLPPGVIGLGFALSFHLVAFSPGSASVLTAVAVGTLVSEVLAALALLGPREES
ncbi:MAG: hypothetical protein AB1635_08190 [Acidobacteriota bacterium]